MHNLGTVLRFELTRTLKKPTFWISILAFPAIIGVVMGLVFYSNKSSNQVEEAQASAKFSTIIMDDTSIIPDQAVNLFGATRTSDKQLGINQVTSGKVDAFFYYPHDIAHQPVEVYNKSDGLVDNAKYTTVAQALLKQSVVPNIPPQYVSVITDRITVNQKSYENGKEVNLIGQAAVPIIFLAVFYVVIALLGNQMLTSTTEEKENRVTEMILTSIKSRPLIIGKIIALMLLGFIQIAALITPVVIAYIFARDALSIPDISSFLGMIEIDPIRITIAAVLLVASFMLFTGLLVGIGAAMPTAKEANGFFGFTILIMFLPFYTFMAIVSQPHSLIVQIFSYFPLTAPITLMLRNAVGNISLTEITIGVTVLVVSGVVAMALAIRIFHYGTLEYSKRVSIGSILRRKKQREN